jgi:polyhydroxybutyrate depolymerase
MILLVLGLQRHTALGAEEPARREWLVDGVAREALVYVPSSAKTNAAPVVFVFHGHGGTMRATERGWSIHTVWPEAIVVYPQGLNTPGRLTDPEGKKPGWQASLGLQGDRDLRFFDAMLASLKTDYKVDAKRIYSTGHSNGGSFTYLLWQARGPEFTAFAPSAAAAGFLAFGSAPKISSAKEPSEPDKEGKTSKLLPKPFFHLAAENDPLVKFTWQKATIDKLRELNQCGEGKPWTGEKGGTVYPSKAGTPVVTYIHAGEHKFPSEGPRLIVKFFKEHALP